MATFKRGHSAKETMMREVKIGSVAQTGPGKVTWLVDPSDSLTLRGIPAIGRGVQGAIPGTRPESSVDRVSDAEG